MPKGGKKKKEKEPIDEFTEMPQEKLIEYITKTISKSIYSHSDPFYFKLILRLIEENAIRNDDHLFAYIDAILQSLISHMKDATKEHRDTVTYRLNTKNLFFPFIL